MEGVGLRQVASLVGGPPGQWLAWALVGLGVGAPERRRGWALTHPGGVVPAAGTPPQARDRTLTQSGVTSCMR